MRIKTFGPLLFAAGLVLTLSACEGDDGRRGPAGPDGSTGAVGAPGAPGTGELLVELNLIGRYASGLFDEGGAEIVAHDPVRQRLFVVNSGATTVDVLNLANPAAPALLQTIDASAEGGGANSVAVFGSLVAVAIEANTKTDAGKVVFYDAATLNKLGEVAVGALPDMLTFMPAGTALLVANEGEPNEGYTVDPVGSVSVIDLRNGVAAAVVRTVGFESLNGQIDALRAQGVRIYGPNATVAQDLEPEYIAVSPDGLSAWVGLQEANAVAVLDLADLGAPALTRIIPLGLKDHSVLGNELDASDRDGPGNGPRANLRTAPVRGLYQPDAIAAYRYNGRTYYVTANEGDDRNDFIPGEETRRVSQLGAASFDPAVFGDTAALVQNANLGRLTVSPATMPRNGSNQFTQIHVLGGRSFSIWSAEGVQLFDSGSDFERITAQRYPQFFNASNDNNNFEDRSDNKGPEPEGLVLGTISGRTFAFIGLERIGGIMVYDITNPQSPRFVQYINPRDFTKDVEDPSVGDLGPEGLAFVSAASSPTGTPLLVVGNEISGTTTVYRIDTIALSGN